VLSRIYYNTERCFKVLAEETAECVFRFVGNGGSWVATMEASLWWWPCALMVNTAKISALRSAYLESALDAKPGFAGYRLCSDDEFFLTFC